jgi:glutaminyl-peptide cyclotransferase
MTEPATRTGARKKWFGLWLAIGGAIGLAGLALVFWPGLRTLMAEAEFAPPEPEKIDGKRAFGYLEAICKIGPRVAGSEANTRQREWVAKHFRDQGGVVREQPFDGVDPKNQQPVKMVNLIGSWFPERLERVLLAVHYDTRPFPDEEVDPERKKLPFIGANDGASGVALLMEIAHHLKDSKTQWGVDLVLLDGEEIVYGRGPDTIGDYFLGSKAFGQAYSQSQRNRKRTTPHYYCGFVLDMVGDKNLTIDKEPNSLEFDYKLVRDVWSLAKALKVPQFRDRIGQAVQDDHLPLYSSGIPTIDIIDFDYPHWHKATDLPENCSAASLEAVGRVMTAWLNKPKPPRR